MVVRVKGLSDGRMLEDHAAKLIGNQAMDFHKQDGVTVARITTASPRLHCSYRP